MQHNVLDSRMSAWHWKYDFDKFCFRAITHPQPKGLSCESNVGIISVSRSEARRPASPFQVYGNLDIRYIKYILLSISNPSKSCNISTPVISLLTLFSEIQIYLRHSRGGLGMVVVWWVLGVLALRFSQLQSKCFVLDTSWTPKKLFASAFLHILRFLNAILFQLFWSIRVS